MVRAFGALSNGGAMMRPHIIKSYSNAQGEVTSTTENTVVGQPVPEETAKTIVDILEKRCLKAVVTKRWWKATTSVVKLVPQKN